MKAIWTNRSIGHDVYVSGFPVGCPTEKLTIEAHDERSNHFKINYCGQPKFPSNIGDFDFDVEVKITLTPKKKDLTVIEFK